MKKTIWLLSSSLIKAWAHGQCSFLSSFSTRYPLSLSLFYLIDTFYNRKIINHRMINLFKKINQMLPIYSSSYSKAIIFIYCFGIGLQIWDQYFLQALILFTTIQFFYQWAWFWQAKKWLIDMLRTLLTLKFH